MEPDVSLDALVADAQTFEFPYCDGEHEDIKRDERGKPLADREGKSLYKNECALSVQLKRPGCIHCLASNNPLYNESLDVLLEISIQLQRLLPEHTELQRMTAEYETHQARFIGLDYALRTARAGTKLLRLPVQDVPSKEEGEKAAEVFVQEHRAIVDSRKAFRDFLVVLAQPFLQ